MKLITILMFSLISFSGLCSDFTCSAKVMAEGQNFSEMQVESYWRSSTAYDNISLAFPKGIKKVLIDLDIDGRVPNKPNITVNIKKSRNSKVTKSFTIKTFGKDAIYKLDKKHKIKISCS